MRALRRFTVRAVLPEPLAPLGDLVQNLRWSWHAPARRLFSEVDPGLWVACDEDPLRLLGAVAPSRLAELAADEGFRARLDEQAEDLRRYLGEDRWYQGLGPDAPRGVAYFSPEFGVHEVLPQYSGGLGILAGDHLKAASDLGVPLVGVGLLYRSGYFAQSLSADGWQQERYPPLDPFGLPLQLLRDADGSEAHVEVALPGGPRLAARVWVASVGRVPLLLMDSDVEANGAAEQDVTDRLYGGGKDHRLAQELLLGVGGVRAVRRYCAVTGFPEPEVFHTNEGHAGFLGLERLRELVEGGLDVDAALVAVRAGTVFTTHTPVPAGIDRFSRDAVAAAFDTWSGATPGVPVERVLELGREPADGDPSVFNMACMGLRLAQRANGVSELHGHVSREMFSGVWPGFDAAETPITSITNGVHAPTWVAPEVFALGRGDGAEPGAGETEHWGGLEQVSDVELWRTRAQMRSRLVEEVRRRLLASGLQRGAAAPELAWTRTAFDPDVLTIGFARRVPSYKRLTLMLRDPERLRALLLHPERPVQLVVAGKSHPADDGGKRLIQQVVQFADDPEVRARIAFLPDYDIGMARYLYAGCDVWLNNPLRPLEACGTSGMKSALNGGLNLSILDGWWDELHDGGNGWAIPTADGVDDPDRRDDLEAAALYSLLEEDVAPRFYGSPSHGPRDPDGVPVGWVGMVRHAMQSIGPVVLASRMVRDYVEGLYAPAATSARAVAGDDHAGARDLAAWERRVEQAWSRVRVGHVEAVGDTEEPQVGVDLDVRAEVELGGLQGSDVVVQAVYGPVDPTDQLRDPVAVALEPDEDGRWTGRVPLERSGAFGYTVRVLPRHPLLASPAETGLVAEPAPSLPG